MSKIMLSTLWNTVGRHITSVQPLVSLRLFSSSCINHLPTKKEYAKIKADPEKYQRRLLQIAVWKRNSYQNNPEYRQKDLTASRLRHAEYRKTSEPYYRTKNMWKWAGRYSWFREQLPWRSHIPILFAQKTRHSCASCGVSRIDGSKLWWKSAKTDSHTCHSCYTKAHWNEAMPEGFGDCRTKADIVARMQQLGLPPP
jgi:hypothetical protein